MKPNIAYYRVSKESQRISGLGLGSQKSLVFGHLRQEPDYEFTETETGTNKKDRPEFKKAIDRCKEVNGRLVIAKLDRLSRNSLFINQLIESGLDFIACDMPSANPLMIRIMAAFAQHEAEIISERTTAALAEKVRRERETNPDFKLGPGDKLFWKVGVSKSGKSMDEVREEMKRIKEDKWNPKVLEGIMRKVEEGWWVSEIKCFLNNEGVPTVGGARMWTDSVIANKIKREKAKMEAV